MLFILLLICFILFLSSRWSLQYFGLSCFEQIIFHTKVPLEGVNTQFIFDWFKLCVIPSLLLTIVTYVICIILQVSFLILWFCLLLLLLAAIRVGLFSYILNLFRSSTFIEEHYVDGKTIEITFPEVKRNLIYIYVESLETTYTSKELGGNYHSDLLAPLTSLSNEGIHFSHNEQLGGAKVLTGTGWTTGGIVAQSGGLPLLVPLTQKAFTNDVDFFPGLYSLGDILKKEGYNQEYLIGSDALFGGREFYYKKHGDFKIFDFKYAHTHHTLPKDYRVFWGFEDSKLLAFAKQEVLELAAQDKPFHFTMLTVDAHHPYGYVCDKCNSTYPEQLSNVIHCNAKQIQAFVEWLKQQTFYDNTTVILSGDHLSMAAEYINKTYDKKYERTVFNTILNAPLSTTRTKNRKFSTLDMFPTTLAAMNVKVQGDKLGLGVNLFSDTPTLLEQYSYAYVNRELKKQSAFYKSHLLNARRQPK